MIVPLLLWASIAYYAAALAALLRRRPADDSRGPLPPVSVLKPVHGLDRDFYACIRSHAEQDYPEYELLFAVDDPGDAALPEIRRLAAEFPGLRIEAFVADREHGPNAKANKLERLRVEARYDVLVVNDSDVRVSLDYLRRVTAPLADPRVGVVTCPYRGAPGKGLSGLLEALWISTDFQVSVLVARLLGVPFALGATIAFRRADLERIGGFVPLAAYLADDYWLGRRIFDLGRAIVLSDCAVETLLPEENWAASWRRRLRWGRTLRVCRPAGYAGALITFAVPLAATSLWLRPDLWALAALAFALRLMAGVWTACGRLRDPLAAKFFWLIPLADFASAAVWAGSLFGSRVVWRDRIFRLHRDGRLSRI